MIQPLQYNYNLSFKGTETKTEQQKKPSIKEGFVKVVKGINTVTGTTQGVVRGAAEGVALTAAIGLIGKNIKEANSDIFKTTAGIISDSAKAAWNTVKFVPALLTKAPVENLKNVITLPSKFYKNYLKNTKTTAAIATAAGLGVLAFRTIQGKINANLKNADVDHATKSTHY